MDKDNTALLKIKELEAAQKLQQKIEELEVAAQKKDDDIGKLRDENKRLLSLMMVCC